MLVETVLLVSVSVCIIVIIHLPSPPPITNPSLIFTCINPTHDLISTSDGAYFTKSFPI